MNDTRRCPIPGLGGTDCWEASHPDSSMGLCIKHWRQAASGINSGHDLLGVRCYACNASALRTVPQDSIAYCTNPTCARVYYDVQADPELGLRAILTAKRFAPPLPSVNGASVVYYIRWADRVKIGVSANLPQRLKALYYDELMAVEPGSPSVEAMRHKTFAEYRLPNYREWFTLSPALAFHVANVRDQFGPPMDVYRKAARLAA